MTFWQWAALAELGAILATSGVYVLLARLAERGRR